MVLLWIGLGIGILIVIILIIKAFKTNSQAVVGIQKHCQKCGSEINGFNCPNCKKQFKSFGT